MARVSGRRPRAGALALAAIALIAGRARAGDEIGREIPDVPAVLPAAFAVMPFENRSGVLGLNWLSAGAAFMVGEKAEQLAALMPAYDALVVPRGAPTAISAESVAAFAAERKARYVWTGWVSRPNWELQVAVALWEVQGGVARSIGEVSQTGEFAKIHTFLGDAIGQLCARAGIAVTAPERVLLARVPSRDFYSFTLFGRALSAMAGTEGAVDLERAQKNLTRSVFIDPGFAEGHRLMAEVYLQQAAGKSREAAAPLLKKADAKLSYALSVRPRYPAALTSAADLALRQQKSARAIGFLEEMVRLRPWQLEQRFQLGKLMWETGDADGAFRELERVVRHRPKDARVRRLLVLIHASRGDQRDLVRELEAVAELDPSDVAVKLDLAAAYASAGRDAEAEAAYRALIAADEKNVQAVKFLADLFRRQGKKAEAMEHYARAIKAAPDDPRAYFLLGEMLIGQGNDKEARRIYQRATRFRRFLGETYNNLGAIAYRAGDSKEAVEYGRRAVERKPDSARFRYNFALALSATGKTKEALGQTDAGLKLEPNHVELHYLRGVVLLKAGDAGKAREEFQKTLALSAEHEGARHNLELLDELDRRAREGEIVIEGKQR